MKPNEEIDEEEVKDESFGSLRPVTLKNTGQIELPTFDISPYIGKKVAIEDVEEFEGKFGYMIRISTSKVATLKRQDGTEIAIRGSRNFSLQKDKDGNVGWGAKTKLGVFLAKMNVKHYNDLKGKQVILQSITSAKDGKDYLTFN